MGSVKITLLADDFCPHNRLLGEHGLAVLVENGSGKVLFDTGQGLVIKHNARELGVHFPDISAVAVSHGHNDHTGGLAAVLGEINRREVPVFAHEEVFRPRYKKDGGRMKPTGMAYGREDLERLGARFFFNRTPVEVVGGMFLTGEIKRYIDELPGGTHYIKEGEDMLPDPFVDDQALVVESDKGLIVVLGCTHAGIKNTLRHIEEMTGEKALFAIFGGTHLLRSEEDELRSALEEIERRKVKVLGLSHCTGILPFAFFARHFKGEYIQGHAGLSWNT